MSARDSKSSLASFFDLLPSIAGLSICTLVILALSLLRFRKQLA